MGQAATAVFSDDEDMKYQLLSVLALATAGSLLLAGSAAAQTQRRTSNTTTTTTSVRSVQQRYGIQGAYDGTRLHPEGRRSTAVPVTMDDGRTGEFVIPSGRSDPNAVYYRDDQSGDLRPVRMDDHGTRNEFVQAPHAVRYQAETQPGNKQSWGWAQDALVVGGSAGGGALIGAAAGGKKGAGVGAAVGGVGGLIYDLLSRNKR
jgi:hypothetical protein